MTPTGKPPAAKPTVTHFRRQASALPLRRRVAGRAVHRRRRQGRLDAARGAGHVRHGHLGGLAVRRAARGALPQTDADGRRAQGPDRQPADPPTHNRWATTSVARWPRSSATCRPSWGIRSADAASPPPGAVSLFRAPRSAATGDTCPDCGGTLQRTGTYQTSTSCGFNTGW